MKTTALLMLAVFAALAPTAIGQQAPASSPPATSASAADLAQLERFLGLSDAELAQMADAIARVRAMTPAQRTAVRNEITAFRSLPEQQRLQIRQGWGWMPPEIQNGWREMMQNATPQERATIQARLQTLSPEEKTRYRRSLVEAYLKAKAAEKK